MSHPLTVELSDTAYSELQVRASAAARSPAQLAAAALEQHFANPDGSRANGQPATEAEKQAARERFERHFGAVNLGHATGVDNEGIDAKGVVHDGVIVPDDTTALAEGTRVRITPNPPEPAESFGKRYAKFKGAVPDLPADLAEQHDHYRLGTLTSHDSSATKR
jgi:hypothetical protein